MRNFIIISILVMCAGCATFTEPEHECRITYLDGNGRVGGFINYGEGAVEMVRISRQGSGCDGMEVEFDHNGLVNVRVHDAGSN